MPKTPYTPTVADNLTGQNLRALRQRRGETLKQTVEASGFGKDASTLAATERGERLLTELEATKLAAHFNTTPDTIRARPAHDDVKAIIGANWPMPATEQAWLGNTPTQATTTPLFAVPDPYTEMVKTADTLFEKRPLTDFFLIDLKEPLTPDQYREQIWFPYLEARYNTDTKAAS